MKINQIKLRKQGKELMIFGARPADRGSTEYRLVAKQQSGGLEQERVLVGTRLPGVVEVRPVLHADSWFDESFDYDFRICRNFMIDRSALHQSDSLILQSAGEFVFVHAEGTGCRGCDHQSLADSDRDRHLQRLSRWLRL